MVVLLSAALLFSCSEEPEPITDFEEFEPAPREQEEGVASAQGRRETPPRTPQTPPPSTGDQRAPDRFTVRFETTKGPILIDVTRDWAPYGADRFYTLVREGYFVDIAFFRVVEGFMAQTGIHGDPQVSARWRDRNIPDDPAGRQSNTRGMVSYAMAGPGTRTTQFFINYGDTSRLDAMGFAPFGRVRDMSVVDRLHNGYGDAPPGGRGPNQGRIQLEGNTYLRAEFPELDYIRSASIVEN